MPRLPRALAALLTCLALALPALPAMAQDNPIIARMTEFTAAYNAGDAAAIAAIYSPDGVILPPGQPAIQGREAIADHYAQAFAAGAGDLQFRVIEIIAYEARAVEFGETIVTLGDQRILGRYMHYWEAIGDEILLARDMYQVLSVQTP